MLSGPKTWDWLFSMQDLFNLTGAYCLGVGFTIIWVLLASIVYFSTTNSSQPLPLKTPKWVSHSLAIEILTVCSQRKFIIGWIFSHDCFCVPECYNNLWHLHKTLVRSIARSFLCSKGWTGVPPRYWAPWTRTASGIPTMGLLVGYWK